MIICKNLIMGKRIYKFVRLIITYDMIIVSLRVVYYIS